MTHPSPIAQVSRLEQYTLQNPHEVLLVTATVDREVDEIAIFKGYSSSLTRPTHPDPDVPILPEESTILTIDRLVAPFNSQAPQYLQQGLTWEEMLVLLNVTGV